MLIHLSCTRFTRDRCSSTIFKRCCGDREGSGIVRGSLGLNYVVLSSMSFHTSFSFYKKKKITIKIKCHLHARTTESKTEHKLYLTDIVNDFITKWIMSPIFVSIVGISIIWLILLRIRSDQDHTFILSPSSTI